MPFTRKEPLEIIVPADDPDFVRAMDYILRRELGVLEEKDGRKVVHRYTVEEYADLYGVSRQSVYDWLKKWTDSGLLRDCRMAMMVPVGEEVTVANRRALSAWPSIIDNMIRIATYGKEHNAVNATIFLWENIVKPQMDAQPDPGTDEAAYIDGKVSNKHAFDPMAVLKAK